MKLKLYLLSTTHPYHRDTYRGAVVAAANARDARLIHPNGLIRTKGQKLDDFGCWPESPNAVMCEFIGYAKPGTKPGVILTDFSGA